VSPDVPPRLQVNVPEPQLPACFVCRTTDGPLRPNPNGLRYLSGGQVLHCPDHMPHQGPDSGPVRAAVGVIGAAMDEGHATAREIAQAEEDAGLLIDPQAMQDVADAAREQAQAEASAELAAIRDELAQAQEQLASLGHFKGQLDGIRSALAGRPDTDLMTVREILQAADPQAATTAPLTVTWDGIVMGPSGDTAGERTLIPLTTTHGGPACLALDDEQRQGLGRLLLTPTPTGEADEVARCARCGCTEDAACEGGCYWVANALMIDLCSSCATPEELQAMRFTPAAEAGTEQDERAAGGEL
jgi:hypothetical protein